MERGDIGLSTTPGQACVFEGLLASPPPKKRFDALKSQLRINQDRWDLALPLWTANELPLKSLIHCYTRLGIATDIITFLSVDAVDPIYQWLVRKCKLVPNILYYESPSAYADDLKYDTSTRVVYVPDHEMALAIGVKATVVSPASTWGF